MRLRPLAAAGERERAAASSATQIAGMRTGIANLETRPIRWMVGTAAAAVAPTFGILRFLG